MCLTQPTYYRDVLNMWFKGTGGGSGETTMFEGWSKHKLAKYNIDIKNYNHPNITTRPAILIAEHVNQRTLFIIIIHMSDKMSNHLLSSRHDPLSIRGGEAGMSRFCCSY